MSIPILILSLGLSVAEAGITVHPLYAPIGHRHSSNCSHKPRPHPQGKWVWVPGKVYKVVGRFGRVRYYQKQGHWKLVPHKKQDSQR